MSHRRPMHPGHRRTAIAVLVGTLSALALTSGCGGSDPKSASPEAVTSTSPATPPATTTPADPATSSAPVTTTPKTPTASPTVVEDEDHDDDHHAAVPATAGGGACGQLPAAEVGQALGSKVTGSAMSGGGCQFRGRTAATTSATVVDREYNEAPGMRTAKAEATSSVEGTPEDVDGIAQEAFVVTGTVFGGDQVQGAGALRIGSHVVNVTVNQETGMSAADVRARTIALLKLVTKAFEAH